MRTAVFVLASYLSRRLRKPGESFKMLLITDRLTGQSIIIFRSTALQA